MITEEVHGAKEPPSATTIISKGPIYSHYIQPLTITKEELSIRLSLAESAKRNTNFFIHECGIEEDSLAQVMIKRNKTFVEDEVDIDDIEDKSSFKIAAYSKDDKKQPLSNVLDISIPGMCSMWAMCLI